MMVQWWNDALKPFLVEAMVHRDALTKDEAVMNSRQHDISMKMGGHLLP